MHVKPRYNGSTAARQELTVFVSPTPWSATVAAKQVADGRSARPIEQTTNTARRMMSRRGTPASPTLGARQGFAGAGPLRSAARCARPRRAVVSARLGAAARPAPVAGRMDSFSRCDNADGLMKPHPCVCTAAPGVEAGIERGGAGEGGLGKRKGRVGGREGTRTTLCGKDASQKSGVGSKKAW